MIKWFVMLFFGKQIKEEKEKILSEVRKLLEDTKRQSHKMYVHYDRIPPDSTAFLYGIQPLLNNKYVITWLNEHRLMNIEQMKLAMSMNDKDRVMNGLSQIAMVDTLLLDIQTYDMRYREMLNQKKEEQNE
jgi:hypothetical protein